MPKRVVASCDPERIREVTFTCSAHRRFAMTHLFTRLHATFEGLICLAVMIGPRSKLVRLTYSFLTNPATYPFGESDIKIESRCLRPERRFGT